MRFNNPRNDASENTQREFDLPDEDRVGVVQRSEGLRHNDVPTELVRALSNRMVDDRHDVCRVFGRQLNVNFQFPFETLGSFGKPRGNPLQRTDGLAFPTSRFVHAGLPTTADRRPYLPFAFFCGKNLIPTCRLPGVVEQGLYGNHRVHRCPSVV